MRQQFLFLMGMVGVLVSELAFPDTPGRNEVPFRLRSHLIVVKASVGNLKNLRCLIDTGCTDTLISRRVARKLNLSGRSREGKAFGKPVKLEEVTLPEVRLGTQSLRSVSAYIADLSRIQLGQIQGSWVDCLIGMNLLRRSNFTIDYEDRKLIFGSVQHSRYLLSFVGILPLIGVSLRIHGHPVYLMLDTGAECLILYKSQMEKKIPLRQIGWEKSFHPVWGPARAREVELSEARLQDCHWRDLRALLYDAPGQKLQPFDGVLAPMQLQLKRLTFDFQQNLISWDR